MSAILAITGLPGAGKTTLAKRLSRVLGICLYETDSLRHLPWAEQASACAEELAALPGDFVVEGLTVARMFRYGFKPDALIHVCGAREPVKPSLPSLVTNGIMCFEATGGRIIRLPQHPSVELALRVLGTPTKDWYDPDRVQQGRQGHPRGVQANR